MISWMQAATITLLSTLVVATDAGAAIDPDAPMDDSARFRDNITLTFTAPIKPDLTTVKLSGPNGRVPVGELKTGGDIYELVIPVPDNLSAGSYVLQFKARSVSGQVVTGTSSLIIPYSIPSSNVGSGLATDAALQGLGERK